MNKIIALHKILAWLFSRLHVYSEDKLNQSDILHLIEKQKPETNTYLLGLLSFLPESHHFLDFNNLVTYGMQYERLSVVQNYLYRSRNVDKSILRLNINLISRSKNKWPRIIAKWLNFFWKRGTNIIEHIYVTQEVTKCFTEDDVLKAFEIVGKKNLISGELLHKCWMELKN